MYVTNFTNIAIYAPDGSLVGGSANGPKDSNGDFYVNNFLIGTGAGSATDSLGRPLVTTTVNGNQIYYDVLNSQGTTSRYTVTTEQITFYGYCSNACAATVFQSIQLPDLTTYQFGYATGIGHYGQLTSITLPTGGQVSYSYGSAPNGWGVSPWVATRTTPDSATAWTYTPALQTVSCLHYTTCGQMQLTVKKPSGDAEVYTAMHFGNSPSYPTEVQYYNGSVSSANLLATITAEYDYYSLHSSVPKTAETTTLPIPGGTSLNQRTEYSWDTGGVNGGSQYGQLLQKREWNFYSGSRPTNPDRTTNFTYLNGAAYLVANILNRTVNVTVTNSSGGTVAQTVNSYDGSTLVTQGATGVTNHDDTNYASSNTVRGNLTQVQKLIRM